MQIMMLFFIGLKKEKKETSGKQVKWTMNDVKHEQWYRILINNCEW